MIRLEDDGIRVEIDPCRGGRIASLQLHGLDVLPSAPPPGTPDAVGVGIFAMVPWAGRVRDGRFVHEGVVSQLPVADDGHALHGLGKDAAWTDEGQGVLRVRLGAPWPVGGEATLRHILRPGGVTVVLSWRDDQVAPCTLGLHPWFRRRLARGQAARLSIRSTTMVERGADGLPTGRLVDPSDGPWDDCFLVASPPVLEWPGALRLTLRSSSPWWVVYDQPADALCVEPQTAPPDAFSHPGLRPPGDWPHEVRLDLDAVAL